MRLENSHIFLSFNRSFSFFLLRHCVTGCNLQMLRRILVLIRYNILVCACFDRENILFSCPALHIHPYIAAMSHQLPFITKSISNSSNTHTLCTLHKLNVIKFGERIEFYYIFRFLLYSISSIT